MEKWSELSPERRNKLLRVKNASELVMMFGNNEEMYKKEKENNWDAYSTHEQHILLRMPSLQLAEKFNRQEEFFLKAREFMEMESRKTNKTQVPHHPPKRKIISSARRDLDFIGAICELIDNSIDARIHNESTEPLRIVMNFDPVQEKGYYYDNAGGIQQDHMFKVFIPGETIEDADYDSPTIGSFAMGAKKAIFHLSDGTSIYSAKKNSQTHFASVPESWEHTNDWTVEEGDSSWNPPKIDGRTDGPLDGETCIIFQRLLSSPVEKIKNVLTALGETYGELLGSNIRDFKVQLILNGIEVAPIDNIKWANPKNGLVPPKRFIVEKVFSDLGDDFNDIKMKFELVIGLCTESSSEQGIDVYGNYRRFDTLLKQPVGYGKRNVPTNGPRGRLIRGKLFIHDLPPKKWTP